MAVCKNCGHSINGKFCSACGQKADTKRIDLGYVLHDLPHGVFHVDKGLLFTMGQLLSRPGKAIAEYLGGKRVRHFNPFSYLIILTSVASLLTHQVNNIIRHRMYEGGPAAALPGSKEGMVSRYIQSVAPFFDKYPSMLFLIMIPLSSLITWLYFRKKGYNFWENVILNTYLTAQFNLCLILGSLYVLISGSTGYSFTPWLILFFTYLSIAYAQFFSYGRKRVDALAMVGLVLLIVFLYVNAFSFSGMMTPWWNF